jgi:thiamine pyridinylase
MKPKIVSITGLIFLVVFSGDAALAAQDEKTAASTSQINVALYPYVPRLEQFKETISAAWKKVEPNINLNFVSQEQWDGGYSIDPSEKIDVFVFESLFLEYFQNQGYLADFQETEIDNLKDIPDSVVNDIKLDGKLYGIPQTGCFNLLFYRSDDKELAAAKSLDEVYQIIGKCPYQGEKPPQNQGLLVNFSDDIMTTGLYLDAVEDLAGKYTPTPVLPPKEQLNSEAIAQLQKLLALSSQQQAEFTETEPYQRATWFAQGFGRAMIGFSESVLAMSEVQERIAFKFIPLSTKPTDVPLLYVEMVGINPAVK